MINKHLDGLEMFLGMFEACSNSSKLQMTGEVHIYRPPSGESRWEPLPKFLRGVGYTNGRAPDNPVTLRPEVAVESSDA